MGKQGRSGSRVGGGCVAGDGVGWSLRLRFVSVGTCGGSLVLVGRGSMSRSSAGSGRGGRWRLVGEGLSSVGVVGALCGCGVGWGPVEEVALCWA